MDIDVYSSRELDTVFRVLRTALSPSGALEPQERLFLVTYARITGYDVPSEDPQPIDPSAVHIEGAHQRKRLIQLTAIAALLSNPVKPGSVVFLKELSRQLATRDSVIDVLDALITGRRIKARMLAVRRAFRALIKEAYWSEGVMGVLRFFGAMMLKAAVNKNKLWDYKRIGLLPEGTLGREYWKHMTGVGFGFPGEPGGIADSVAYHDIGHVLAEHETTPMGEIQQGSFQGGNRREDGFFFIQFVILQFHHGIRITPVTPPQVGNFDPEKVLWAIHRGAKMNVDITHQWNFWPLMSLGLQEARAKVGLLPKLPARA
ncbi:MAG TPA: hypothetical protein VJT81_00100 [Burkholderiales bacterium]|nr:hypothetical protein [Burkholderiales bacterium]